MPIPITSNALAKAIQGNTLTILIPIKDMPSPTDEKIVINPDVVIKHISDANASFLDEKVDVFDCLSYTHFAVEMSFLCDLKRKLKL
jgi:hypothetical protein